MWNTVWVTKQAIIDGKRGGSIVITSSTAGLKGLADGSPGADAYVASKHGLVGLMRALALRAGAPFHTGQHGAPDRRQHADGDERCHAAMDPRERRRGGAGMQNALPVDLIEASDVTNAILWLVSDMARYVTGVALPVDAGFTAR